MGARKIKVSLTLGSDLVAQIDRTARRAGANRSNLIEAWLRRAAKLEAAGQLEGDTIAYYEALTADDRRDDAAWAKASGHVFGTLAID